MAGCMVRSPTSLRLAYKMGILTSSVGIRDFDTTGSATNRLFVNHVDTHQKVCYTEKGDISNGQAMFVS